MRYCLTRRLQPALGSTAWVAAMLAFSVAPVYARQIHREFNYQFDAGGEVHGFTHNDPGPTARAQWQPGGALGSIGCLKTTGGAATVDSRYSWFRAGESTLSFHYYAHGYRRIRLRINVARAQDRQGYGRFGNHWIRGVPQDKWVFVQVKVTDIPGDARGGGQGYPDLVLKSVTFIGDQRAAADGYLLTDNVRLGPRIGEKDIRVRTRGRKTFGKAKRTLLDFERAGEARLVRGLEDVTVSRSGDWASTGKHSLKLVCTAGKRWATFEFDASLLKGWEAYDYLTFDFYSRNPAFVTFRTEVWDPATKGYHTRCTYEGQAPQLRVGPVHQGLTRVKMDLRYTRRNGKEGLAFNELSKEDKVDIAKLTKFKAWFRTTELKKDYVVYVDNIRLMQEGALESNMRITLPKGAIAFDFGEGTPLVEGFTEASVIDAFGPDKPFGFVKAEDLRARGRDWPDPLTGDFIGPAVDADSGRPTPASIHFRARVPNGRYVAWVCAGTFPWPNLYTDLNINGRLVFSAEMTGGRLYSEKWFFRFLNTLYSEKPHAVWRSYVARAYPGHVVETEVKRGEFYIKGTNAFVSALVLVPAADKAAFDTMVKQIEAERIRFFYRDLFVQRPANEPCRIKDPDFALFAPAPGTRILPWSGMGEKDASEIKRVAAPGEAVPFQVALRPFRDAKQVTLSISDLRGPGQTRIPATGVDIYLKRYMSDGENVRGWCLLPRNSVPLEKGLTRAFWLRLRVPSGTPAGTYKGTVVAAAGATVRRLAVEIRVYPIRLNNDIPMAIGFYYSAPDGGQFAMFDRVKDFGAERDRILREQMELLRDYGMTSISLPPPRVTRLRGSGVALDLTGTAKVATAAKAAGLFANPTQKALVYTLGIGRSLPRLLAPGRSVGIGKELELEGFGPAYVSGIMQLVEWSERSRTPLTLWVVDEPRENPNPWNRNLADTIEYLKLAGQAQGALRMITPMGDQNSGKDYMSLLDHLEIVATHATKSSAKMIARAMKDPKIGLWIYNVGPDRFSNGFYLWRVGATGKHEWHFNQWINAGTADGYPGRDVHNPFLNYAFNPYTVPAPLRHPGALLPMQGMMTMSAGATDYRYIYTLEQAIARCKRDGVKATEVKAAEKFLAALRNVIPVLPKVAKLATEADLALVGEGIDTGGKFNLEVCKRRIAEFIVALQKQ